ncbi:MAG TPA: DUF1464 family protein [Gemmatimonadales bacterium]|nr:DUF1464 family protein [Gemmatimonadales bacterium]
MPRVAGVDPGTITIDVCVLDDGELVAERSWTTEDAVAAPESVAEWIATYRPELLAGPSGYGLPLVRADRATDDEWRLAFLAAPSEEGGIGGLRALTRALASASLPLVFLPGVVHLDTVPRHRKLNRVDLGTADKVCSTALAVAETAGASEPVRSVSLVLLEVGGAFTAAIAVEDGRIVDGLGGTAGPPGWRSAGAWDGEVAFLAGRVTKAMLFAGGLQTVAAADPRLERMAMDAVVEGAAKAVQSLRVSAPRARRLVLSGRYGGDPSLVSALRERLGAAVDVVPLRGFATVKHSAQGAAILADGLAGGRYRELVDIMRIRHAGGTVLDHLFSIPVSLARRQLGMDAGA